MMCNGYTEHNITLGAHGTLIEYQTETEAIFTTPLFTSS